MDPQLQIYIHTWSVFSNNVSWRPIQFSTETVTEQHIYDYFSELRPLIQHVIIEDDSNLPLIGNLKGTVCKGKCSMIGWKKYWYGKYRLIQYLKSLPINNHTWIINTRFDVLTNSCKFTSNDILRLIYKNKNLRPNGNTFMFRKYHRGFDNLYMGDIKSMYQLIYPFVHHLDDIHRKYFHALQQEELVFLVHTDYNRNFSFHL